MPGLDICTRLLGLFFTSVYESYNNISYSMMTGKVKIVQWVKIPVQFENFFCDWVG